jgi:hypothetical protein
MIAVAGYLGLICEKWILEKSSEMYLTATYGATNNLAFSYEYI